MISRSPDVLIIGGGIAGTALAYYCVKEGLCVSLVERGYPACGTSGANQGNMSIHTRTDGIFLDLNVACLPVFRNLRDELGFDFGFEEVSGLLVTDRPKHLRTLEQRATQLEARGLDVRILFGDEVLRLEPSLSRRVLGGLICSEAARINSPRLVAGFVNAATRQGLKVYRGTEAYSIRCSGRRVSGVATSKGVLRAGTVVIAAGAGSQYLAKTAGIDLPMVLSRGELLVTEGTAEIGRHLINELETTDPEDGADRDPFILQYQIRLVLSREKSGNCLVGRSSETVVDERRAVNPVIPSVLSQHVTRFLPSFRKIHVIRAFAGIRALARDGFPIIGAAEEVEGLFFSAAHGDKGVNTSPVIAKLLASRIVSGEDPDLLKPFSVGRFLQERIYH